MFDTVLNIPAWTNYFQVSRRSKLSFNQFVSNALFLYPMKISENRKEVENGCIGNKWVNSFRIYLPSVQKICIRTKWMIPKAYQHEYWSSFTDSPGPFSWVRIFRYVFKGTLMQIRKSPDVLMPLKIRPRNFRILNPNNSQVILP